MTYRQGRTVAQAGLREPASPGHRSVGRRRREKCDTSTTPFHGGVGTASSTFPHEQAGSGRRFYGSIRSSRPAAISGSRPAEIVEPRSPNRQSIAVTLAVRFSRPAKRTCPLAEGSDFGSSWHGMARGVARVRGIREGFHDEVGEKHRVRMRLGDRRGHGGAGTGPGTAGQPGRADDRVPRHLDHRYIGACCAARIDPDGARPARAEDD